MIRYLALGLLAPLLALPTAATASAPVQPRAAAVSTSYGCDSDFGSGSGDVRVTVKLPARVAAGRTLTSRPVTVSLRVPKNLVDTMRDFGVSSVEGSSDSAALRVGKQRVRVRDLTIPRTRVPARGALTLRGTGTADAFSVRRPGTYVVRVPARLVADITATVDGFKADTTLRCDLAPGAPSRLGSLTVRN